MEFVASILTTVDFGFKTSKLLYYVISGVKDGPDNVRQTAIAIYGLLSVLEQLSKCRALDESGSEALRDRLLKCVDDLESFDGRLKGLIIEEAEKRCGRYWKRLKAVYNEKALDKMRAVVVGHTAALNLHLATLQSETVFGIPDQLATIDRRLVSQQMVSQIPGQLHTITQELVRQRTERQNQTTMWEEHRVTLGQVSHGVNGLQQGIDSAKGQVVAAQRAQDQKLDQILEQMLKLTLERQQPSRVVEVPEHGSATPEPSGTGPCSELMESLTRLCRLVDLHQEKRTLSHSTDVVKSLLALLSYMMSGEFLQGAVAASLVSKGACDRCCGRHVESLKECLSSVYGVLLSSRCTTLNHHGEAKRLRGDSLVRTHNNATTYMLEIGTLLVCSSSRYYREASDPSGPFHPWTPSTSEEVTMRISFIPSQQQAFRQLFRITSHQSFRGDGVFSSVPILAVNRVIPADFPVFTIVKEGRLDEFIALLRDGDASVRDHDEEGACLLHYANRQPAMCQYLIKSGVDVNTIGGNGLVTGWEDCRYMCSPLATFRNDDEVESEEFGRILICRKYLLDAGSDCAISEWDPTDVPDEGLVGNTLRSAVPEAMKILLDEISFDGCRIVLDESPLVYSLNSGRCGLGGIKLLLQRGASVHDRDRFGNTCLHRYLERPGNGICDADASTVKDAFTYLIQQGADVLAQNHNGVSVSDVAYTTECTDTTLLTKFREELWDCVLANCGYDLAEFRRCRGRRFYNHPLEFMKGCVVNVWAGCDHLRPDYDNKTSPIYFSDCDDACDDRALRFLEGRNCGCMDSHDVSDEGDSAMEEVDQSDWSDREEVGDEGDSAMEDADDSDWSDSEDGGVTCV